MKKICFLDPYFYKAHTGGAEIQLYIIAKEFVNSGWEVHYITGDTKEKKEEDGIIFHPFQMGKGLKGEYKRIRDILLNIDADVYYQRGRKAYTYFLGRFCDEYKKNGVFAASMDIDCNKYKGISNIKSSNANFIKKFVNILKLYQFDKFTLEGMKKAAIVLSQTHYQQNKFWDNLKIKSSVFHNLHHVPTLIEREKKDPPIILWLSNIKDIKRPELFINFARKLCHKNWEFVMAGKIQQEAYRNKIEKAQKEISNFRYTGHVSFDKSNELIAQASILVNTSRSEGFSNTFIQAWLRKTPVVTLNIDPDGIITKNELGICSSCFGDMIYNIEKLMKSKSLRIKIGNNGYYYAIKTFGIKNNFPKLLKLIVNGKD